MKTKKICATLIILSLILSTLSGCGSTAYASGLDDVSSDMYASQQNSEETYNEFAEATVTVDEAKNLPASQIGEVQYVLTLEIKQSHFSLDLGEHLKDATNTLELQIPTTKEYYDSVKVGDKLTDKFRLGSLIFKSSIGKYNVKVKDKIIVGEELAANDSYDGTQYVLTLKVKQKHFTLDVEEHLKDAANNLEIQIPVSKSFYDSVEVGTEIADDFRLGSLIFKSSIGKYVVTVSEKTIM